MFIRLPINIDFNHPEYLYLIFTGPPLNIYQIFMNIPLKLVAPRCFGSSGFRHFWANLTHNCRKFCFQQDTRPVCGPAPSRDLCLSKLVIPIIICLWHNEQSGWLFAIASTKYKYERRRVCILHATLRATSQRDGQEEADTPRAQLGVVCGIFK